MSEIILDNLGLSSCIMKKFSDIIDVSQLRQHDYSIDYIKKSYQIDIADMCWENLLNSIVLWDSILINCASTTSNIIKDNEKLIVIFSKLLKETKCPNFIQPFYLPNSPLRSHIIDYECEGDTNPLSDYDPNYGLERTMAYVYEANAKGANYLPHPYRAQLLKDSHFFYKNQQIDRAQYIKNIDTYIKDYIESIQNIDDFQLKSFPVPVLYSFIKSNTNSPLEELKMALNLRKDKRVKKYKKSVEKIETELKKGNLIEFKNSIEIVRNLCDDVTQEYNKKGKTYSFSIGLSPSISCSPFSVEFGVNLFNFQIEHEIPSKIKTKLHTTFLCDLANFGLTGKNKKY